MNKQFQHEDEILLMNEYLKTIKPYLVSWTKRQIVVFCNEYRAIYSKNTFLNDLHSSTWIDKLMGRLSHKYSHNSLRNRLSTVKRWTYYLFIKKIIDDDALFYVSIDTFKQKRHKSQVTLSWNLQRMIAAYLSKYAYLSIHSHKYISQTLHPFNLFLNRGQTKSVRYDITSAPITEDIVLAWINYMYTRVDKSIIYRRVGILKSFFSFLKHEHIINMDPIENLLKKYPKGGSKGIVNASCSENPTKYFSVLKPEPQFASIFSKHFEDFIRLKISLGGCCESQRRLLSRFDKFLRSNKVTSAKQINEAFIKAWFDSFNCSFSTIKTNSYILKIFFDHLIRLDVIKYNPIVPSKIAAGEPPLTPYIYSKEEIATILKYAKEISAKRSHPAGETCYMMILLIYALGLRHGEATRLCIKDIDLSARTVAIYGSKFHKSRLLPLGEKVGNRFAEYIKYRKKWFKSKKPDDLLFINSRRSNFKKGTLLYNFHKILKQAGIRRQGEQQPRIHDLRHTFAVHRLLKWYKDGADVQAKLPLLSTFLGHVNIKSTQVYLTITLDILKEANRRFEKTFGEEVFKNVKR